MDRNAEVRKEALVEQWLEQISDPDEGDRILLSAIVSGLEEAYNFGLRERIKTP